MLPDEIGIAKILLRNLTEKNMFVRKSHTKCCKTATI